jgi:glycosyltransferase involved in cell wall biosynthesis
MASVDVAIPCYQYGRFLRGCVASVLSQEIHNLRVLIIDNASSDNSLDVARSLAAEDNRVEVVAHPTNLGHHASYNEGIDWASADYFMTLCADDLLPPGSLRRAVTVMEKHPEVHLTFGRVLWMRNDDPVPEVDPRVETANWTVLTGRELLEDFCRAGAGNRVSASTVVVRTAALKRTGYYRPELPNTCDMELWMRIACLGKVAETEAVQAIGRVHSLSLSAALDPLAWEMHREAAFDSFFAHEGASIPDVKRLRRLARRALSERTYWGAVANLFRGDPRQSLAFMKFALTRHPANAVVPPFGYLRRRDHAFHHIAQIIFSAAKQIVAHVH